MPARWPIEGAWPRTRLWLSSEPGANQAEPTRTRKDEITVMTTPNPARRPRRQIRRARQTAIPVLGLTAAAAALTLSASTSPQPVQLSALSSAATAHAAPGQDGTLAFTYTGNTQTVTVPGDVGYAQVTVLGASGGNGQVNKWLDGRHGYGVKLSGTLLVKPGDVLTVAVGGEGGAPNGNKSPGAAGWSISPYAGGRGGSGHGLETTDGGGGGGASVIQLNGTTVVAAAGGGGEGGETVKGSNYSGGGNGGVDKGQQGNFFSQGGDVGGPGGSSSNPSLNPVGVSWTRGAPAGGGGGGGGGRYPGGGGKPGTYLGSGGGGGGASLRDALQSLSTGVASSPGNGSISVTWLPAPDSNDVYAFEKTPTTQLLEVNGAVTDNGGTVDTWQRILGSDNKIVPNELWTYESTRTGYGEIVNNNSGKCLEVNATNGTIDQWQCVDGSGNESWKLVPNAGGGTALQIDLTGAAYGHWHVGTYYVASTVDPASVTDGTALTLANTQSDRTAWDARHINS
jgi:hypothetical protein